MTTGVNETGTKDAEEVQQTVKYDSTLSYILSPPSFFTQIFKYNNKELENILNNMCNFGVWEEWRSGIRSVIYYLDFDTSTYLNCFSIKPFGMHHMLH